MRLISADPGVDVYYRTVSFGGSHSLRAGILSEFPQNGSIGAGHMSALVDEIDELPR